MTGNQSGQTTGQENEIVASSIGARRMHINIAISYGQKDAARLHLSIINQFEHYNYPGANSVSVGCCLIYST